MQNSDPINDPPHQDAARDWSHVQGFQSSSSPADDHDYTHALKKELTLRVQRFLRCMDSDLVLSGDGFLRWLGAPIARLVAGENLLQPSAILLADSVLEAEERASLDLRIHLWLSTHLRKLLAPLFALGEDAELSPPAQLLASKIVESLGILERDPIRTQIHALDNEARKTLRKHGVRFGTWYIYIPLLLKPAARGLSALLWSLRCGSNEDMDRILAYSLAGRTSFANEGLLSPESYRIAGFRLCGDRAVRVDIVERLSDMIYAALSPPPSAPPAPAQPRGFVVTQTMTSLVGCAGESFAGVLRSLGLESQRIPKTELETAPSPTDIVKTEDSPTLEPQREPSSPEPPPDATSQAPSSQEEDSTIETWRFAPRPRKHAPPRHRNAQASSQTPPPKPQEKETSKARPQAPPPKPTKPPPRIDPDSPFAQLAGLKTWLEDSKKIS